MHPVPYKCLVPNKCLPLRTCTWMSQNSKFYTMHEDILLANNSLISYQSTRHVNQCDWKKAHFKEEKNVLLFLFISCLSAKAHRVAIFYVLFIGYKTVTYQNVIRFNVCMDYTCLL